MPRERAAHKRFNSRFENLSFSLGCNTAALAVGVIMHRDDDATCDCLCQTCLQLYNTLLKLKPMKLTIISMEYAPLLWSFYLICRSHDMTVISAFDATAGIKA